MSPSFRPVLIAAMIGSCAPAVIAQSAVPQPPVPTSQANAAAASPAARATYRSAFDEYRGYGEQPVSSWRQANDLVLQIGGWQTYAREGQAGESGAAMPGQNADAQTPGDAKTPAAKAPPGNPAAPAAPATGSHSGHHKP